MGLTSLVRRGRMVAWRGQELLSRGPHSWESAHCWLGRDGSWEHEGCLASFLSSLANRMALRGTWGSPCLVPPLQCLASSCQVASAHH